MEITISELVQNYGLDSVLIAAAVCILTGLIKLPIISYKKYNYNAYGEVVRTESYVEGEELTTGKTIEETVFDAYGNAIKSYTYNSLDSSSKLYTERRFITGVYIYIQYGCKARDCKHSGGRNHGQTAAGQAGTE